MHGTLTGALSLAVVGAALGQEVPTIGAIPGAQANGRDRVAAAGATSAIMRRAGDHLPTGRLIVRPLQPDALVARGLTRGEVTMIRTRAAGRIASAAISYFAEVNEYIVPVPPGLTDAAYSGELMATGDYQYAASDCVTYPLSVPNDPLFPKQWHHERIGSATAWDVTTGDPELIIAFVDTGIDVDHPDLADHRVPGFNSVSDLTELDGGKVDDVSGHGTLVAGIAGAIGNNALGVAGVTWDCRLMMCRCTDNPNGLSYLSDDLQAIRWAANHGAKVVNVSRSGVEEPSYETTGQYVRSKDALLVVGAANDNANLNWFDWSHVTIVGATSQYKDSKASYSNYGKAVDLFAPGDYIWTTQNGGGYTGGYVGTSLSTPIVSGAAALIWSVNPDLPAQAIEEILFATCKDLGDPGDDWKFGHGRVDLAKAVVPWHIPVPFLETFPSNIATATTWDQFENATTSSMFSATPPYSLRMKAAGSASTRRFALGPQYDSAALTFWTQRHHVDAGHELRVEYYSDADAWRPLLTLVSDGQLQTEFVRTDVTLPSDALHDEFRLRFSTADSQGGNPMWFIDDISLNPTVGCYADFSDDGLLDLFDFLAYVNRFNAGEAEADCDDDGVLTLFDFLCFVNVFNAGC